MDNPQRSEDGYTDPGRYVHDTDATKEAAIQAAINDVQYLMGLESHGNASVFTFHGSADARKDASSTRLGSDNICISGHSTSLHFSPTVDEARGFNTSQNISDPYIMAVNSSNPTNCCNHSASNYIVMNETFPDHTKTIPGIWGISDECPLTESQQDTNYDKTFGLIPSSQIAFPNSAVADVEGQYTESHDDLSQIARSDNEQYHTSDGVASNGFFYSGGIFEASASSGCHRDENTPNVVGKMSQSFNKGEIKSTKYEEVKALICGSCKEDISQQVAEENILEYVDSLYYNREGTNLVFHRSTHVPKTTCNICGKEHAVENSHKNEHSCTVPDCKMTFPCRTRLYQHIPEHRSYFKKNCWVCIRTFKEHVTENDFTAYVCCVCGFPTKRLSSLEIHNIFHHLPRCFCQICKTEYPIDNKNFHGIDVKCIVCNNIFKCRIQLEEHFESHVKYFYEHCRISESNKKISFFRCPFRDCPQFVREFLFKYHLYEHANLLLFDCETCGRRFFQIVSFNNHKLTCKELHYKCEICETRFLTLDLLHSHGLVKHNG